MEQNKPGVGWGPAALSASLNGVGGGEGALLSSLSTGRERQPWQRGPPPQPALLAPGPATSERKGLKPGRPGASTCGLPLGSLCFRARGHQGQVPRGWGTLGSCCWGGRGCGPKPGMAPPSVCVELFPGKDMQPLGGGRSLEEDACLQPVRSHSLGFLVCRHREPLSHSPTVP